MNLLSETLLRLSVSAGVLAFEIEDDILDKSTIRECLLGLKTQIEKVNKLYKIE